jgi:NADH-quinone oxidoreductase subunit H
MNDAIQFVQTWVPPWLPLLIVIHLAVLGTVAYLILLERKVASWAQDRIGPNRVGFDFGLPFLSFLKGMNGLGQPLADGIKFILKEDYRPKNVDRILFTIAPIIMIIVIIISIAVVPWGGIKQTTARVAIPAAVAATDRAAVIAAAQDVLPNGATVVDVGVPQPRGEVVLGADDAVPQALVDVTYRWHFQIANLDIGVLFILATLSLAVYGVVIGGWASNNKYSFLGGLRATANMISYEIPLGLAVLVIVVMFGTLDLTAIVDKQLHYWAGFVPAWNVFVHPLAFFMFLICIHAEANRAPFDMAEAEQELVGGYHTEYSAMRFALFFLAEYAGMITTSMVCVALFFGGWHLPWIEWAWPALAGVVDPASPAVTDSLIACIVRAVIIFTKTILVLFVFMWVRWSLPRFRFDQLMNLAWRALIPISLVILLATAVAVWWWGGQGRAFGRVGGKMALFLLGVNVACGVIIAAGSMMLPSSPDTNRRIKVANSRYARTPIAAGARS